MNVEVIIVLVALVGMLAALIMDKMRPGMILFSVVVLFRYPQSERNAGRFQQQRHDYGGHAVSGQ